MSGPETTGNADGLPEEWEEQVVFYREFCDGVRDIPPSERNKHFRAWSEASKGFEELMDKDREGRERGDKDSRMVEILQTLRPYPAIEAEIFLSGFYYALAVETLAPPGEKAIHTEDLEAIRTSYNRAMSELRERDPKLHAFLVEAHLWFAHSFIPRKTPPRIELG